MKRTLAGFAAGALTASAVFLVLGQERIGPTGGTDTEIESVSNTVQEAPQLPIATPENAPARSSSPSAGTGAYPNDSPFDKPPESTPQPRENLRRLGEQSFEFWSENKDRFAVFANEVRDTSAAATTLENGVTNEVWRVAGSTYPPFSSKTECRSSACRVRLSYGTAEELSAATRSNFDLSMLAGLEQLGFVSVDKTPAWGYRALDPDPDAPGETLDVYFWRESESGSSSTQP